MAIADSRQRFMPLPDDREPDRGQALDYPEAVLLINPVEPEFQGEVSIFLPSIFHNFLSFSHPGKFFSISMYGGMQVDDKYQYSVENKDNRVHGWISSDPPTGFWQITPGDEFRSGGPVKQCLASHVGPTNLAVSISRKQTDRIFIFLTFFVIGFEF